MVAKKTKAEGGKTEVAFPEKKIPRILTAEGWKRRNFVKQKIKK